MVNGKTDAYPSYRCTQCTLMRNTAPGLVCWECIEHNRESQQPKAPPDYWGSYSNNLVAHGRMLDQLEADIYKAVADAMGMPFPKP